MLIDLLALLILALFILASYYRGSVFALFSLGVTVISLILAFILVIPMGRSFRKNEKIYSSLLYYFEGNEYINKTSVEMVRQRAENTSAEELDTLISNGQVPMPIGTAIKSNVLKQAYAKENVVLLGEYFNRSVVNSVLYILSFLVLFVVLRILLGFLLKLRDFAQGGFPLLKRFNAPISYGIGFLEGILFLFVLFMLVPVVLVVLPKLSAFINKSLLGNFFYKANLLLRMLPKT
jgi:hypothetical protein